MQVILNDVNFCRTVVFDEGDNSIFIEINDRNGSFMGYAEIDKNEMSRALIAMGLKEVE